MKKAVMILIVLALMAGTLFANGSPEDQRFFEELLRNNQSAGYTSTSSKSSTTTTGSEIISRTPGIPRATIQYKCFFRAGIFTIPYPAAAPAVFRIISSTSNDPRIKMNWINSAATVAEKQTSMTHRNFRSFLNNTGKNAPIGTNKRILTPIFLTTMSALIVPSINRPINSETVANGMIL